MLDLLAIDELLAHEFGIDIEKALDPLDRRDFTTLVQRFADKLGRLAGPHEINAVDRALSAMDVDWHNLTPAQRDAAVKAANTAIRLLSTSLPPKLEATFKTTVRGFVGSTKRSMEKRWKLGLGTSFDTPDQRVVEQAIKNQGNFITDYLGRRAQAVEQNARAIVADGLERGLGNDEIADNLEQRIKAATIGRSPSYWRVVSNSFMNRSRVDTNLRGFKEAGIRGWTFEAVLDEVTTDQCRMLHGKEFTTDAALQRMRDTQESDDPVRAMKEREPWLYNGKDSDGNSILYTRGLDGSRTVIAHVLESGVGTADKIGRYDQLMSDDALMKSGIPIPPLHGRCRSTIQPVF